MVDVEDGLKTVVTKLKSILQEAGLRTTKVVSAGHTALIRLSRGRTHIEVLWRRLVNDAVLLSATRRGADSGPVQVFATGRLSKQAFRSCVERGVCALDTLGNGIVRLPGLWFERYVGMGGPRRPSVSGTPFTAKASRIVRALLSYPGRGWTQSELVDLTGVTQGYASKCLRTLTDHAYVVLVGSEWRLRAPDALLDDWAAHYRFDRHAQHRFAFSSPTYDDGLQRLGSRLQHAGVRYAFTGWSGAHLRAPYAIPPKTTAFVDSIPGDVEKLGLFGVTSKENALLIIPHDEGVFQFSHTINGLHVASDAQIYVDLCRLAGRAKEQADVLRKRHMAWAGTNE